MGAVSDRQTHISFSGNPVFQTKQYGKKVHQKK
jgi:hypothetical protein